MTVATPAGQRVLSTPQRARAFDSAFNGVGTQTLEAQISEVSDRITSLIGVTASDQGTATLGYEEVIETFYGRDFSSFLLQRFPVVSITSFTIDGVAVPVSEYSSTGRFGRINLHTTDLRRNLRSGAVSIRYFAGWFLPTMSGYPALPTPPPPRPALLPVEIEHAMFQYVRSLVHDQGRDMGLREMESDEVDRFVYFGGGAASQAWIAVKKRLSPYIRTIF